jgi:hypothetical protein
VAFLVLLPLTAGELELDDGCLSEGDLDAFVPDDLHENGGVAFFLLAFAEEVLDFDLFVVVLAEGLLEGVDDLFLGGHVQHWINDYL